MKFMNKTQQLLKEREEEFDNKFGSVWNSKHSEFIRIPDGVKRNIKSFHATTISLLLNSLKEEVENKKWNKANGWSDVAQGYNNALDDISTLLSETISNIQTK